MSASFSITVASTDDQNTVMDLTTPLLDILPEGLVRTMVMVIQ